MNYQNVVNHQFFGPLVLQMSEHFNQIVDEIPWAFKSVTKLIIFKQYSGY